MTSVYDVGASRVVCSCTISIPDSLHLVAYPTSIGVVTHKSHSSEWEWSTKTREVNQQVECTTSVTGGFGKDVREQLLDGPTVDDLYMVDDVVPHREYSSPPSDVALWDRRSHRLMADQLDEWRLILFDVRKASNPGISEHIVVRVVVRG